MPNGTQVGGIKSKFSRTKDASMVQTEINKDESFDRVDKDVTNRVKTLSVPPPSDLKRNPQR